MKRVFVTRKIHPEGLELLRQKGFQVDVAQKGQTLTAQELHEEAQKSHALICTLADSINNKFLHSNSHLVAITNYAVGLNNIDVEEAKKLNIKIGNTPDVLTEATAEVALGLMICAARNFKAGLHAAERGGWIGFEPLGYLGPALKGKTLGVIGMGRIGSRLAEMAQGAFQMKIKAFKRGDDLQEYLKDLDVVSLHMPLTPDTRNFIGKKEFQVMKPSAIIINTARGEVIDQDALVWALKEKLIFAAGLDVTTPEPLPIDHELFSMPNVFITPHFGSATYEARSAMSVICAENIIKAFSERE